MSQPKDPNQGEGDRLSARRYDRHVREFIDEGKVPDAANAARTAYERDPEGAAKDERAAKRFPSRGPGGRWASVDELVAKSYSVMDRLRPAVQRAVGSLRSRFANK